LEPISNIISRKLVLKSVGFAPPKCGQPKNVPGAVTTAVLTTNNVALKKAARSWEALMR
jgi:hypothetical protein